MEKERNHKIDNIRAISILMIILAHCGAPLMINNIRTFDVITLVFLSEYIINEKIMSNMDSYRKSLSKRIRRLLEPTFFYIIIMVVVQFLVYSVAGRLDLLTGKTVINSFLLCENSIGYVWIMKVYLINYLVAPLLYRCVNRKKPIIMITVMIVIFATYQGLLYLLKISANDNYLIWIIVNEWLMYGLFYMIVALNAIFAKLNEKWNGISAILWCSLLVITSLILHGFQPAMDK